MVARGFFAIFALAFTGLGLAGAVLPGLPTAPFLLFAVACGHRGWPGLARSLESHPRWGRTLTDWRLHRAVSCRAKRIAGLMMALSWVLLAASGKPAEILALQALIMGAVLAWLWRLPDTGGAKPCG